MAGVRIVAVTNQKGGVGKTTTAVNLAAELARLGRSVCLVDLDPQAHLTMHFGLDPAALSVSMYDVITAEAPLASAAVLVEPHLTVIPSTIDLAAAEVELAGEVGREQVLRHRFAATELPYELIFIDCPPSLGLLTLNALAATDEVLIPLQPHFLALQGLGRLLETVSLVQQRINPKLKVSGLVFCLYESATRLAAEVIDDVRTFFDEARGTGAPWSSIRIFQTRIRRNIKLAECPSHGTTIAHYDPSSHGAQDYAALAREFLRILPGIAAPAQAEAPHEEAVPEQPAPMPTEPAEAAVREARPPATVADGSTEADNDTEQGGQYLPAKGEAESDASTPLQAPPAVEPPVL